MMEQQYTPSQIIGGVLIALAIVFIGILAFNWGEIVGIITTEGLLSK